MIRRTASAGTLESSDCLVTVSPGPGVEVELRGGGGVFSGRTDRLVREVLRRRGEEGLRVLIQDRGALELVLEARLETALARAEEDGE